MRDKKPLPEPHSASDWIANFRTIGIPPSILLCIAMWFGLSIYWSIAARNRSAARSSESVLSRQFHLLLIAVGQILVFFPFFGPRARFLPASPWLGALGVLLCFLGLVFAVAARRTLGRNWSGEVTTKVDHTLVTSGPYALVRHPIYTSAFVMYGGTALASGELHAMLGVALVAVAYARKIPMEEKVLAAEFGPAWYDYRARTKALIPFVL